jgi:hypothetical protein
VPPVLSPPTAARAPQNEIGHRSQGVDLQLEITLQVAHGIEKHLDHFFGPERPVAFGLCRPGLRILHLEEDPPLAGIPDRPHPRGLGGRLSGHHFAQGHSLDPRPIIRVNLAPERLQRRLANPEARNITLCHAHGEYPARLRPAAAA